MKKVMIIAALFAAAGCSTPTAKVTMMAPLPVRINVWYSSAPAFTNGQYYVFADGATGTNALNGINNSGWFPIEGHNAKTGAPAPDKAATVRWTDTVQERLDGKWVFPRIPTALMDAMNVPEAEREAWWNTYLPDVEMYQTNWFPEVEE